MTATTLTNLWKSVPPPVPPGTPVNLFQLIGTRRENAFVHDRLRPGSLRHFLGTHLNFRFRVTSWFPAGGMHFPSLQTFSSVLMHRFTQNGGLRPTVGLCHKTRWKVNPVSNHQACHFPAFSMYL
jgi:hypothetical protein